MMPHAKQTHIELNVQSKKQIPFQWRLWATLGVLSIAFNINNINLVHAQAAPATNPPTNSAVPAGTIQQIKSNLLQVGVKTVNSVQATPIKGIYEVVADKKVFYSDGGDHLFMGDILNIKQKINLTDIKRQTINTVSIAGLPLTQAISWKRGKPTPSQMLVVFSDPNCGHCKQFAKELTKMPNIQVYEFIIPILGEDSFKKSKQILCLPRANQVSAWHNLMNKNVTPTNNPDSPQCAAAENMLKTNMALAQKLEITGTPTLFFKNGSRAAGALSAQELESAFAKIK